MSRNAISRSRARPTSCSMSCSAWPAMTPAWRSWSRTRAAGAPPTLSASYPKSTSPIGRREHQAVRLTAPLFLSFSVAAGPRRHRRWRRHNARARSPVRTDRRAHCPAQQQDRGGTDRRSRRRSDRRLSAGRRDHLLIRDLWRQSVGSGPSVGPSIISSPG